MTEQWKEKLAGKFGSAEELVKSYKELESAFTKKSQEASALKAQIKLALSKEGDNGEGQTISNDSNNAVDESANVVSATGDDGQKESAVTVQAVILEQTALEQEDGDNLVRQNDESGTDLDADSDDVPQVVDDTKGGEPTIVAEVESVEDDADNNADIGKGNSNAEDKATVDISNNDTAISEDSPADYQQDIDRFFDDNAAAIPYAEKIGERIKGAPDYSNLLQAYNEVLSTELNRLSQPPTVQALLELAGNNAEVTEGILGRYIESLRSDNPPVTIKGGYGLVAVTPPKRAKNLSDAAGLAKSLLEK